MPAGYAFPALTGRVVDAAHLLSPAQQAALAGQSAALEKATGHQFVVVTVPDLGGHPIEAYGRALGNHWRIGRSHENDGVLLLVAPGERKVRIEVGYGLEKALTDPRAAEIIARDILPRFRAGDLPGGIAAGAAAITRTLSPAGAKAT